MTLSNDSDSNNGSWEKKTDEEIRDVLHEWSHNKLGINIRVIENKRENQYTIDVIKGGHIGDADTEDDAVEKAENWMEDNSNPESTL